MDRRVLIQGIGALLLAFGILFVLSGLYGGYDPWTGDTTYYLSNLGWLGVIIVIFGIIVIIIGLLQKPAPPSSYQYQQQSSPQQQRYCNFCGKSIPLESILCPYCGMELPKR
jgi:hypothetical protein